MKNRSRFRIAVFAAALVCSAFFALWFEHPLHWDDDGQYDTIGANIAEGRGFSLKTSAPFEPTMHREPLYPFFLGCIYRLVGRNHAAVRFAQAVLFGLTCLTVFELALDVFGEKIAKYAALLTTISPPLANFPSYILAETLFTFLLCLTALLLTKASDTGRIKWFLVSGTCLGLSCLCKSMLILFFVIAAAGLVISGNMRMVPAKKKMMLFVAFILTFFAVVAPWSYRNYRLFGTPQISLRGGNALWEAGDRLADAAQNIKHEIAFNFSEYLGDKLFPGTVSRPQDFILRESNRSHEKELRLSGEGHSPVEIDRMMAAEGKKMIMAHPFKFLAHMPVEFIKMTAFIYLPELNEPRTIAFFNGIKYGVPILSMLRGVLRLSAYPILLFAAIGIFITRYSWRKWFFIAALIVYVNVVYSMLFALGRYAVPLIPFYLIFASAGFIGLLDKGSS